MSLQLTDPQTNHETAPTTTAGPVPRLRGGWPKMLAVRVAGAVGVLFAVVSLGFFALRLIPGDPVDALLGGPGNNASAEVRETTRQAFGLDAPVGVQYLDYLSGLVRGDLGVSYQLREPVSTVLGEQLGGTLLLAVLSLALAWAIALGLAIWSAQGGRTAAVVGNVLEIVASAVPHFWLGSLLILLFSVHWQLLPATSGAPGVQSLVQPVLTLAIPLSGFLGQVMRESMLSAMNAPFALSARARGESLRSVGLRHALRHAALPGIGLSAWAIGSLVSGAVVVESVFARPGVGRALLQAVAVRDVPVVLGAVILFAAVYIIASLLADLAERLADPRLRS